MTSMMPGAIFAVTGVRASTSPSIEMGSGGMVVSLISRPRKSRTFSLR